MTWWNWRADAAHVLDVAGPGHGHALGRPAEVRRHLLRPLERRAHRPRPARRKVREGPVRSPELVPEELVLDRHGNAIEGGKLVRRAVEHTLGARTVVAADVDDQGVVELTEVFDRLDDPADLVVRVREVRPVDVRLLDEELLLLPTERIPLAAVPSATASAWHSAGMMPSRFWLAKMVSRSLFQPSSNRCMSLIFLIHSGVG